MLETPILIVAALGLVVCGAVSLVVFLLQFREGRALVEAHARRWLAEAVGTFALAFCGVLAWGNQLTAALAHGLALAVMSAALGSVSGGHFNPAVTLGFIVAGRLGWREALGHMAAQLVGATVAALLLAGLIDPTAVAVATPDLARKISPVTGTILEGVATFFLALAVFGTGKELNAVAVGLAAALGTLALGPLTGGAINPARFLGPALASGHWNHAVVYLVGPFLGGAAGAAAQHFLMRKAAPTGHLVLNRPSRLPRRQDAA